MTAVTNDGAVSKHEDGSALRLSDVSVCFERAGQDRLVIVDHFDLTVEPGQMHCFAGRSGSGKTSVLKVAAGLTRPTTGVVSWSGIQLGGLRDDAVTALRRKHVGYLDQGGILLPGLTALENVLLPAIPDRRATELGERALHLLTQLDVVQRADQYPTRLSGGERQRVALARALLLSPMIVMADEPTASLDRVSADNLIQLLTALRNGGRAVLVASHDPYLIATADTITTFA